MRFSIIVIAVLFTLLFSIPGFSDQATHDLCLFNIDDSGVRIVKIVTVNSPLPKNRKNKIKQKQFRYRAVNFKNKIVATGYFTDPRLIRGEFVKGNIKHAKIIAQHSSFFLRLPPTAFLSELLIEKRKIKFSADAKSESWQEISTIKFDDLNLNVEDK